MNRSYSELMKRSSFFERYEYLKLQGSVGIETFGSHRYLNQALYQSHEWRKFRRDIILRDKGWDLGFVDRDVYPFALIHHINPISKEDVLNRSPLIFDPENVILTMPTTHQAIHYGDSSLLVLDPIIRTKGDTVPWLPKTSSNQ